MAVQNAVMGPTREEFAVMSGEDLIARYRRGLESFDPRIFELSDEQMDAAFLPDAGVGLWPVRVLVGHVADAELSFSHRMRRAVAEDNPIFAVWDESAFVDSGLYADGRYPVGGFIAVIHTIRRWMSEWLATLTPAQLDRMAMHPERGPMSVKTILTYSAWHLEHHAAFLNAKICKMLGPAPEGGCCGGGCGCSRK